ncbi:DUF2207 domain-containing protein [Streptomyces sp. NPDC003247]|uniref:DUF2207 domain-containing protein n=1 Tax=Streptomyces sp. NPDC003247 TaxID=3364677 RepID=UPI0036A21DD2
MSTEQAGRPWAAENLTRARRVVAPFKIFFLVLLLGGLVALFRVTGNVERVTAMWVGAEIAADGSIRVTEVVDYDFGYPDTTRHGIYRDLPDLPYDEDTAGIVVTMDGARVPWELTIGDDYQKPDGRIEAAPRIKVGDPDRSVTGVHRYRIQYTLTEVVRNGELAWDAVGTGWRVDRHDVEIHVVAPYDLTGTRCVRGTDGSEDPCTVHRTGPGRLAADLGTLEGHEGVTLSTSRGQKLTGAKPALPEPPSGKAAGETLEHPLWVALLAFGSTLACAAVTIWLLRLLGRDRIVEEGPDGTPGRTRRVSLDRLAASLPPSPVPPEGLTPAQGGILLAEQVASEHQAAWLLGAAVDGHITFEGDDRYPTLKRREAGDAPADPVAEVVLDTMFAGRDTVTLGLADARFRSAWETLADRLTRWQTDSGLWDAAAARRARVGRHIGTAATLTGFATAALGAWLGGGRNPAGTPVLAAGLIAVGVGFALRLRAWELQTRTPRGAALWLRTEAFRRHLLDPSPHRDGEPLDEERVELYTAWSVSLQAEHPWQQALADSTVVPRQGATVTSRIGPALAIGLVAAAVSSSTAPSSGGGGGGGGGGEGGGVGGGDGGGGGGSW